MLMENEWGVFTQLSKVTLYQRYAGEIRFGPWYFELKSEPVILALSGHIFGDWFFTYKQYIFIQQWNSTQTPDTNLLRIDADTLEVTIIKKNIPAVLWGMKIQSDNSLHLECNTGNWIVSYPISQ